MVFVDKALSMAGTNSYYNPEVITETTATGKNGNSGVGVNLGGVANALGVGGVVGGIANAVNVQGGRGNFTGTSATRTLSSDRFLTIPAKTAANLVREEMDDTKFKA